MDSMDSYLKFHITRHVPNAAHATPQAVFVVTFPLDIKYVRARYRTGSVSGVLNVVKSRQGQPFLSGTSVLASTIPLFGSPDTRLNGNVNFTTSSIYRLRKDESLGLIFSGDLTGLEDLDVTATFMKLA